jgi:hypothetical protein
MWLDLRPGARVKLSKWHNHQGARQPNTIHIGGKKTPKSGRAPGPGLGAVSKRDDTTCSFKLNIESCPMKLGLWWLEAAARGGPALLPVVNQKPCFEGEEKAEAAALNAASTPPDSVKGSRKGAVSEVAGVAKAMGKAKVGFGRGSK